MRLAAAMALFAGWLVPAQVFAAGAEFTAQVDRDLAAPGEQFQYVLTLTTSSEAEVADPRLGKLPANLAQLGARTGHSQVSFSFGTGGANYHRTQSWIVVLSAGKTGAYTIPPSSVTVDNQELRSNPVSITITEAPPNQAPGAAPPPRQPRAPAAPAPANPRDEDPFGDDPFGVFGRQVRGDVFIQAIPDKAEAFTGEPIALSLYLFSGEIVSGWSPLRNPRFDGFWVEEAPVPRPSQPIRKRVNGRDYTAYLMYRVILFGLAAGDRQLEEFQEHIEVRGGGFFAASQGFNRSSPPVKLRIKPLPAEDRPPGFHEANVGSFSFSVTVDKEQTTVGQPVTVTIRLTGRGNLRNIALPILGNIAGTKIYEPTLKDNLTVDGLSFGGEQSAEYLVVPLQPGRLTVPALAFAYFDPVAQRYQQLHSPPLAVAALPAGEGAVAQGAGPGKANGGKAEITVRYLGRLEPLGEPAPWLHYFWPAVLLFAALPAGSWATRRAYHQLKRETPATRRRRELAQIRRALRILPAPGKEPGAFLAQAEQILLRTLVYATGEAARGQTKLELSASLQSAGLPEELIQRAMGVYEQCAAGRYAPGGQNIDGEQLRKKVIQVAKAMIAAAPAPGGFA